MDLKEKTEIPIHYTNSAYAQQKSIKQRDSHLITDLRLKVIVGPSTQSQKKSHFKFEQKYLQTDYLEE